MGEREGEARELLAVEFRADGWNYDADRILEGKHEDANVNERAIRAIEAALTRASSSRADVVEECARVAEADHRSEEARRLGYEPEFHIAGQNIAAAIRALSANPGKAGEG